MKKLFYSIMAVAALAFTSCEDVPMPYDINFEEKGSTTDPTELVATGSGTAADPFNIVAAQKYIEAGINLDKVVYVKGKISNIKEIDTSSYGNATYSISDNGTTTNQFLVYRGYALGNVKFTSSSEIKVGDEVIVCGKLINYNGTKEFAQGNYIYSLNGKGGTDTPATNVGLTATFAEGMNDFTIVNVKALPAGLEYIWKHDATNKYMKASAFKSSVNYEAQSRIVSPAFSLKGLSTATLKFQHTGKYFDKTAAMTDAIKVLASTDGTTWNELTINGLPTGNDWTFVDATCDMTAYAGKEKVFIAFEYNSTSTAAPTWEVKNVEVK